MEKLTRLTDPGQQTTNTQVMGITNENKIFEGIVIDVISYDGMVPSVMTVEGRTYDGNMFVEFVKDFPLSELKIYDECEYLKLKEFMTHRAVAFKDAEYYLKKCKRILLLLTV